MYRSVCYKVEDVFVKLISKKLDSEQVTLKVESYRKLNEEVKALKKEENVKKVEALKKKQSEQKAENEKIRQEKEAKEKQEVLSILDQIVDTENLGYTQYEFKEVKRNKQFFISLIDRVFEPKEKGLTFLCCEFDKSSKREIKGYLVVTNKRVLFLTKDLNHMEKFRYQTIINVSWFKDGLLERGLHIQYGKKKLEFDEIFDMEQLKRVGDLILSLSSKK
ncbi:vacuolar-type H+-ATPase subunit I/STV1 [Metabacillus crassostreae]|uniref:PH domain-containing protein n=1 Tax=Metabacillus crassostreae TaxID=929098 RepID=UPI0019581433|nr:PH domain-containing protein [Metabacillus crassostreae]MBM7605590.1 vacuolar-type H+-ATPase subunit I/STV1 [Metabacillus crassostreae]